MRTAACTCSAVMPASRSTFSCATMHMPQPFTADTASDQSSKSCFGAPGLAMTFMRSFAGSLRYSSFSTRWRKR
jgi:hypothetical protein